MFQAQQTAPLVLQTRASQHTGSCTVMGAWSSLCDACLARMQRPSDFCSSTYSKGVTWAGLRVYGVHTQAVAAWVCHWKWLCYCLLGSSGAQAAAGCGAVSCNTKLGRSALELAACMWHCLHV